MHDINKMATNHDFCFQRKQFWDDNRQYCSNDKRQHCSILMTANLSWRHWTRTVPFWKNNKKLQCISDWLIHDVQRNLNQAVIMWQRKPTNRMQDITTWSWRPSFVLSSVTLSRSISSGNFWGQNGNRTRYTDTVVFRHRENYPQL